MEEASTSDYWKGHPRFTSTGTIDVPVFYPTIHEMRDFPTFIDKIEQMHHAHLICGIVKVPLNSFSYYFFGLFLI